MNKLSKAAVIVVSTLALSGCGHLWGGKKVPPITNNNPAPIANTQPTPMNLGTLEWKVYDYQGLKDLIEDLEMTGETDTVFYVLRKDGYEVLAGNVAEMERYIRDQKDINTQLHDAIAINAGKAEKK